MNIGIIVAMGKELRLLTPLLNDVKETIIEGKTFYSGTIGDNNIVVMQCGIGKVNAAIGTLILSNNFDLHLIINTGVAGGADKNINVIDVTVGRFIAFHDVWCGPGTFYGEAVGFLPLFESVYIAMQLLTPTPNMKFGFIFFGY